MDSVKYPYITVELVGHDGNAFVMLGRVRRALARHGVSIEEIGEFTEEATKKDYDHLLQTAMRWVEVR